MVNEPLIQDDGINKTMFTRLGFRYLCWSSLSTVNLPEMENLSEKVLIDHNLRIFDGPFLFFSEINKK